MASYHEYWRLRQEAERLDFGIQELERAGDAASMSCADVLRQEQQRLLGLAAQKLQVWKDSIQQHQSLQAT